MQGEFSMNKEEGEEQKNSVMEAVHLEIELEKRRIREEMIASEIIQKRKELEAEVRMELLIEKHLMGMKNSSDCSASSAVVDPRVLSSRISCSGLGSRSYLNNGLMNVGDNDLMTVNAEDAVGCGGGGGGGGGGGTMGKWPFERDPRLVGTRSGGTEVAELGGGEVFDQAMPSSGLSGMKRKAETSEIHVSDEEAASVACKNLQKKWYCSLCDVSATSSGGLNLHLHGKKHKAKEALSKSSNVASSISADSFSENVMQIMDQSEIQVQPSEEEKNQMQLMEEERCQVQLTEEKGQVTKKWECSLCQICVTSEMLLNSHLQGKKHQTKEAIAKSGAAASNIRADSCCSKNVMQTVGRTETLVQPAEEEKDQMQSAEEESSQVQPMEEENSQVKKKWECSLCQISVTSEILLKSHLQGKKHKAKEVKLGIFQGTSDNCTETTKAKGEIVNKWYCSLCQVSAPSEKNLNDHFQGKKHKAKAGLVIPEADDENSKSTEEISEDSKMVQENSLEVKDSLNNEQETSEGQVNKQKTGNRSNILKFWHCKMCNEGTYDEATMAYHRKSSKHKKMLQKTGGGLIVVSSVRNGAVEGGEASEQTTLVKDNDVETEN